MGPIALSAVMGGEQPASVLATVRKEGQSAHSKTMSEEEEIAFKQPILDKYEEEGNPYYSTARLWDDGIIDPRDTRNVLALGIAASLNAPMPDTPFGVFRMYRSNIMPTYAHILVERSLQDKIATNTMRRPEVHNAFNK